jgi:DNA-binding transcriptional LysR family regulator
VAFDAALRVARSGLPGKLRHLRIGLPIETSRDVLSDILTQMQRRDIEISVVEASTSEQQSLLATGEIDIGVMRHPFDAAHLWVSPPVAQPLGVAMSAHHPLAETSELTLTELSPYELILFPREMAPGLYDELVKLCREGGYVPPRILHGVRMTATFLRTGSSVMLTTGQHLKRRGEAGSRELVWRPLKGNPIYWWTSVVCRQEEYGGPIKTTASLLCNALRQREHWVAQPRPENLPAT